MITPCWARSEWTHHARNCSKVSIGSSRGAWLKGCSKIDSRGLGSFESGRADSWALPSSSLRSCSLWVPVLASTPWTSTSTQPLCD